MTVDDAVMQKLWKLTNELTAQLVFNRNATLELKQQLAELQAKTALGAISIAGDITTTKHQHHQDHADIQLRIINERLVEENSQLQEQVREYERWMEYIMTKFRLQNFAMAQSRKEAMQEAYKMAEQEGELAMRLQDENAALQARLVDVGAVARRAINEEYYNTESLIETLEMENQGLREMLGVASGEMSIGNMRHPANRVSFPSTGSYVATSGSDREREQHSGIQSMSPTEDIPSALASLTSSQSTSVASSASNSTLTSPIFAASEQFASEPEAMESLDLSSERDKAREPTSSKQQPPISSSPPTQQKQPGASKVGAQAPSVKGGMTINTGIGSKKGTTPTQKTKKPNRKMKA